MKYRKRVAFLSFVTMVSGFGAASFLIAPECDENCQGEKLATEAEQELAQVLPQPVTVPPTTPEIPATTQPSATTPVVTEADAPIIPDQPEPQGEEPVATTEAPLETTTTTTLPPTTTIPPPGIPDRNFIAVDHGFAWLTAPALGWLESQVIIRANEADDGHKALLGNPAWFPSTGRYESTGLGLNDLSLPGEGGVVAVGAHRTSKHKPFANLHMLVAGDKVEVMTGYGIFTYEVTKPCPEGDQDECTLPGYQLLGGLLARPHDGEVLYLFSCDDGMRIFVEFKLVAAVGHVG